jgi:uncharacterized protein HemX
LNIVKTGRQAGESCLEVLTLIVAVAAAGYLIHARQLKAHGAEKQMFLAREEQAQREAQQREQQKAEAERARPQAEERRFGLESQIADRAALERGRVEQNAKAVIREVEYEK